MKWTKNKLKIVIFFALLNLLVLIPAITWTVNYPSGLRTTLFIVVCISNFVSIVCVILSIIRYVTNKQKNNAME